jgi:hypothetical protein
MILEFNCFRYKVSQDDDNANDTDKQCLYISPQSFVIVVVVLSWGKVKVYNLKS